MQTSGCALFFRPLQTHPVPCVSSPIFPVEPRVPANPAVTFFDWDDTLLCSSFLKTVENEQP